MFGKEQVCSTCSKWQRDGGDGICRAMSPKPAIMVAHNQYTVVWPRTGSQEWCSWWRGEIVEAQCDNPQPE
jgi:hypothetical protein